MVTMKIFEVTADILKRRRIQNL